MDKFVTNVAPPSSDTPRSKKSKPCAKQCHISAARRAQVYVKGVFNAENGRLYCRTCNTVVDHTRKFIVDRHLESQVNIIF